MTDSPVDITVRLAIPRGTGAGLLNLPNEVLDKIVANLNIKRLCELRLTCRRLNFVVERKALSHVVIDIVANPSVARNQITALVHRETTACEFARTLCIRSVEEKPIAPVKWLDPTVFLWNDLRECLGVAVANLRNVNTITWNMADQPIWLINSILHSIAFLPSISNVTLDFDLMDPSGFHSLRGLRKLSVASDQFYMDFSLHAIARTIANSPELEFLELRAKGGGRCSPLSTGELFSELDRSATLKLQHVSFLDCFSTLDSILLPHLRSLTSFHWSPDHGFMRTAPESIWLMFMREKIALSELLTSELDGGLMQYLCSFEGLRKLEINVDNPDKWSPFSDTFYDLVLPRHAHSLQVLGAVTFREQKLDIIVACQRLTDLTVWVSWRQDRRDDLTRLLIDNALQLPSLFNLTIVATVSESNALQYLVNLYPRTPGMRYPHIKLDRRDVRVSSHFM